MEYHGHYKAAFMSLKDKLLRKPQVKTEYCVITSYSPLLQTYSEALFLCLSTFAGEALL